MPSEISPDPNATNPSDELLESPAAETETRESTEDVSREWKDPNPADDPIETESVTHEPSPLRPEITDRFARLERSLAEQNDLLFRLSRDRGGSQRPESIPDKPPVDRIETMDDLAKFLDWREQRLHERLRGSIVTDASAVASEQRARGLFSQESMGEGHDYDSLTNRHLEPIERENPGFRQILSSQKDPAAARYALAMVLEVIDRFKGDPVKGFKNLWRALDGNSKTSKQIFEQVRKGAERQVGRTNLPGSRSGSERRKGYSAEEINGMSVDEFTKKFPHLVA